EGVDRIPRLDLVQFHLQAEHGVLQRDFAGGELRDVGVDAVGVRLEEFPGFLFQQRPLLLGDPAPAHGADDLVGRDGRVVLPHEFRESARGEVTAVVHLEEPVLRVHVALGVEQVGGVVTVEVGNPVFVSDHLYTGAQAREVDVPRVTGKRAAQGRKNGNGAHDEKNDEGRGDPQGNATHNTR